MEFKTEREDVYATCPVQVMKEIEDDLVDAPCGEMTLHGHAGYCKSVELLEHELHISYCKGA